MKRPAHWFRGDVDGLRAIAIVAVVVFHAHVPGFDGGFTGVDVFFVISGWLITRNLLLEATEHGRVRLGEFWARRIRRLVPALGLVVALTLLASRLFVPVVSRLDTAAQALAAIFYVSNFYFIDQATDYFAADPASSPFLHTWSLGVEEQFYVVWPILIALVSLGARLICRRSESVTTRVDRRLLLVLFTVVFVASFAHNLVAARAASSYVFFSITTRAWEFAAAGMLAACALPRGLRSARVRSALGVVGLVTIAVGVVVLRQNASYPGIAALVPVAGTLAVILAGETFGGELDQPGVSRLLATGPAQWIGRVSYSWYLWHWPAMVIVVAALPEFDRPGILRIGAGLGTLPIAWLAYRFYETPVRFSPTLSRAPWRTFVAGGALTAMLGFATLSARPPTTYVTIAADLDAPMEALQAPPGSTMDERVATAVGLYRARVAIACPRGGVEISTGDVVCYDGTSGAETSVMLMGDSHAGQWRRTFHQLGLAHDFTSIVREHDGCAPMVIDRDKSEDNPAEPKRQVCREVQHDNPRVVNATRPDVVVLAFWVHRGSTMYDSNGEPIAVDDEPANWQRQTETLIEAIQAQGSKVAIVLDAPFLPFDPAVCLPRKGSERCVVGQMQMRVRDGRYQDAIRNAATDTNTPVLDLPAVLCADVCQTEIDGVLTYVDEHHFTDAYALAMKDDVWDLIVAADPVLADR